MGNNYGQNTTSTPETDGVRGKTKNRLVVLIVALVFVAIAAISAAIYFGLSGAKSGDEVEKEETLSELREDIAEEKEPEMKAEEKIEVKSDEKEVEVKAEEKESEEKTEAGTGETVAEDEMKVNMTEEDEKKLQAVETVEAKDTFEVKITNKSVVKNAGQNSAFDPSGRLILELGNKTGKEVKQVDVLAVGYRANEGWAILETTTLVTISPYGGRSAEECIKVFSTSDGFFIPKDSSEEIVLKCVLDGFIAIKAIVASYTDEDGTVHENPIVEEWVKAVAGRSDPATIR